MLTGNKRLRLAMHQTETNLAWKAWYVREKNPKADEFAQDVFSWKGLYRLTLDLQNVFKTLTFEETEFFQKLSQASPTEGPLHLHVQALLREEVKKEAVAFELYQRAARQNFKPAQDMVAKVLHEGKLGQDGWGQERFAELQTFAAQGWKSAQKYAVKALYDGKLGQDERSQQDRFDELKTFAAQGWTKAQKYVVKALTWSSCKTGKRAFYRTTTISS